MASGVDSILGGSGSSLTDSTRDVLTGILQDTVGGTPSVQTVPGGTVVVAEGVGNESQLGVVAATGSVQANISTGDFQASVVVPQGGVVGVQGPAAAQTPEQTNAYMENLARQAIPDTLPEYRSNVLNAVQNAMSGGDTVVSGQGPVVARVMQLGGGTTVPGGGLQFNISGTDTVVAGGSAPRQLLVVDTSHAPDATVVLSGVSNAVVTGSSRIILGSGTSNRDTGGAGASTPGTAISGDMFNQTVVGGAGRDTIFGGGGIDSVTGGTGPDVFGITGASSSDRLTITDLSREDQLLIKMTGINSVQSLLSAVSGVTDNGGHSYTVQFNNGSSVTLVGVPLADITADMLQFG